MRFQGRCFRTHDPRWSFSPLSGAGAAQRGGRFNRKGDAALYLSVDLVTAVRECQQGLGNRLQPLLICEYGVDCDPVADLRSAVGRKAHGVDIADLDCAWLSAMLAGKEPPSWRVADRLRAGGHIGALVPSFAPGAQGGNLILWQWGNELPTKIEVFDPDGRLPLDQSSWKKP